MAAYLCWGLMVKMITVQVAVIYFDLYVLRKLM